VGRCGSDGREETAGVGYGGGGNPTQEAANGGGGCHGKGEG